MTSSEVLNQLSTHYDFLESIGSICDMGCGTGKDIHWWATAKSLDEDDNYFPLNIECTGVDLKNKVDKDYLKDTSIEIIEDNFEKLAIADSKFDVIWSHDSFQYAINPLATLKEWNRVSRNNAMLYLAIPQTTNILYNRQDFTMPGSNYYHHTLVSLIQMLAVNGWDCRDGFFLKEKHNPWIHAIVYKSTVSPMDPRSTRWADLIETNLLPESACAYILRHNYVKQQDLILPWLNGSMTAYFDY